MRLSFTFTVLLAAVLGSLTVSQARPVTRAPSSITLPIRALHAEKRSDVHPLILYQQHVNRAVKRHALMAGTPLPSDLELRENLEKRLYILGEGAVPLTGGKVDKRMYKDRKIDSVLAKLRKSPRDLVSDIIGEISALDPDGSGQDLAGLESLLGSLLDPSSSTSVNHKHHHQNPSGGDPTASPDGSDPTASPGGSDPTASPDGSDPTASPGSSDPTPSTSGSGSGSNVDGAGFSPVALGGLENGGLTNANPPSTPDSLGLAIEADDTGYVATVSLGTPPRDFAILMDSGSADFWVGGESCQSTSGGGCGNHVFLGSQSSSSFQDSGKAFSITYGSGQVSGTIVKDDLTIAGLALPGHVFGVASQESVDFSADTTSFDGLMGLAQSTLSNQNTPTPVEALASAGLIPEAITSYKLSRLQDGKNDGEITFGSLDTSKFDQSTLVSIPNVNTQGFWEAGFSITVNGQDLGLQGRTAILDTGTTLIIAPEADAAAFHQQIPGATSDGQGNFIVPCTGNPAVSFNFGGTEFTIDPRDLLFAPVDPNNLTGQCQSAIASGTIGGPQEWLVGDVFLKNVYYSTDVGKNSISLAKLT